jgi:hypothetical protein
MLTSVSHMPFGVVITRVHRVDAESIPRVLSRLLTPHQSLAIFTVWTRYQ